MPLEMAIVALASAMGLNFAVWLLVGCLRFCSEGTARLQTSTSLPPARLSISDVAVLIPAHNEETTLPRCIQALLRIVPASQIHVASDGSRDGTVGIALSLGCQVLDIQPNGGKARALQTGILHFDLTRRYRAVLIQDADSEIDRGYLENALPLFDDPSVVVVAGHVLSRWDPPRWLTPKMLYAAYRTRLYRLLQSAFQYGQSWKRMGVSYIAPGFASMYRTSVLDQIDIAAPGLVIEDFNMTFEVQHKKLGRIAYTPSARCSSEDPFRFGDYCKQVLRWYLGFWQTVNRHGVWPGKFWLALGSLITELALISLFLLALPVFAAAHIVFGTDTYAISLVGMSVPLVSPVDLLIVFILVDYGLTVVVAVIERRAVLLIYGLAFPALRLLDAALFLFAAVKAASTQSDGRWSSPTRRTDARIAAQP
jgi:cellulose synthase/poly-beta-1,6-N-acetylglucosamine synthase-like glycosyltransferase